MLRLRRLRGLVLRLRRLRRLGLALRLPVRLRRPLLGWLLLGRSELTRVGRRPVRRLSWRHATGSPGGWSVRSWLRLPVRHRRLLRRRPVRLGLTRRTEARALAGRSEGVLRFR